MGEHRVEVHLDGERLLAGAESSLGSIPAVYNLTMDPFESTT